ncbi:DsbA family oxidoreductase [Haloparvum sp. PAK95]|uniref:DsbA family oxidoreductase n=1 Tax=Haloparvum sp. PAK95 TaxID=3418962 RepID=UPI003D2EA8FB
MSQAQSANEITVVSDYVCPFCYLGRQSLEDYQDEREEELEINWHPFDLRAGKRTQDGEIKEDVDDGKDEQYYEQARQNVRRLQEEYDVDMAMELVDDVDSLNAQIASLYVKEHYSQAEWLEFDEAVFDALWQDERDIGDVDVLAAIAEDVGLDGDEVRSAVDDDAMRERVETLFAEAKRGGISGVPTFIYDGRAASGALPPEQLERLVESD